MKATAGARTEPRVAGIAALVADASRARMLCFLLGGEWASASELAQAAGVTAATASGHLARLLAGGLVVCESRGRHRYYRMADAEVAHALEALALVADRDSHARAWSTPGRERLRFARCCYGHLAGRLGVGLLQGGVERGWLVPQGERAFGLSEPGARALDAWGLDGSAWQRRAAHGRRPVAYACLDWSERRDHLAGPLAVALLGACLERGWLRRAAADRAIELTPPGRQPIAAWTGPEAIRCP